VKVRLDRGLCSADWLDGWPDANLKHLTSLRSDHCPILLKMVQETNTSFGRKCTRYEIMWER
jgi:hypothetical protein